MSLKVVIECDGAKCDERIETKHAGAQSDQTAWAIAEHLGWERLDGYDFCSDACQDRWIDFAADVVTGDY